MSLPFLIVGDGPHEPSGLGRIARDLVAQLGTAGLDLELVQVGGSVPPAWTAWEHYPLDRRDDWGAECVTELWRSRFGTRPGVLFLVWDPGRCYAFLDCPIPVQRWAYMAVDAPNRRGSLGGPAAEAVNRFDRVLAYGRWASTVLRPLRDEPVPYLPHGLVLEAYSAPETAEEAQWVTAKIGPYVRRQDVVVGCVATNQPRKDLGLYFEALAELTVRGVPVYGWLHTDTLVKAWSIQQLVEDCGLSKRVTVTLDAFTDRQLALLYRRCAVTIAPGLGEGFGYPIVESLAAGVPVLHGGFGGGAELVPRKEWRFPQRARRLESVYALERPVFTPVDVANALQRVLDWRGELDAAAGPGTAAAYCQGSVAHLRWSALWPRWRSWFKGGL